MANDDVRHFRTPSIILHWTVFILVVATFLIGFIHDSIESKDVSRFVMDIHRVIGLAIVFLTLGRMAFRLTHRVKDIETPIFYRLASAANQVIIYGLMIALPVIGLIQTGAARSHPTLFGVVPIPSFTGRDRDLADQLGDLHANGAWLLLVMIGLHATAALFHHYVRKDDILTRMIPRLARAT